MSPTVKCVLTKSSQIKGWYDWMSNKRNGTRIQSIWTFADNFGYCYLHILVITIDLRTICKTVWTSDKNIAEPTDKYSFIVSSGWTVNKLYSEFWKMVTASNGGVLTTFPECYLHLEFPDTLLCTVIVFGNSWMVHCGILVICDLLHAHTCRRTGWRESSLMEHTFQLHPKQQYNANNTTTLPKQTGRLVVSYYWFHQSRAAINSADCLGRYIYQPCHSSHTRLTKQQCIK